METKMNCSMFRLIDVVLPYKNFWKLLPCEKEYDMKINDKLFCFKKMFLKAEWIVACLELIDVVLTDLTVSI